MAGKAVDFLPSRMILRQCRRGDARSCGADGVRFSVVIVIVVLNIVVIVAVLVVIVVVISIPTTKTEEDEYKSNY